MISENTIQELQDKKRQLQISLSSLLDSKNCSKDDINELKSEIMHIDKLIEKKVGTNELNRLDEVRRKKSRQEELTIKAYYGIKNKYKQVSTMNTATNRLINIIDKLKNNIENTESMVKVRS